MVIAYILSVLDPLFRKLERKYIDTIPKKSLGSSTISESGCGPTSYAMVYRLNIINEGEKMKVSIKDKIIALLIFLIVFIFLKGITQIFFPNYGWIIVIISLLFLNLAMIIYYRKR